MSKKRIVTNTVLAFVLAAMLFVTGLTAIKTNTKADAAEISADTNQTSQPFEGWGTSLAWWANGIGDMTMTGKTGKEVREELMQLIFGDEGLRFNIVRYNVGGGDHPDHDHLNPFWDVPGYKASKDAPYDWEADARQVWVLKRANEIVGDEIVNEIFSNTPPYFMTESGCASGRTDENGNAAYNFDPEKGTNLQDFVTYLCDVYEHLEEELGIQFDYINPLNEPANTPWKEGNAQEGCVVLRGKHQSMVYRALYEEMQKRGMQGGLSGTDDCRPQETKKSWEQLEDDVKELMTKISTHTYENPSDKEVAEFTEMAKASGKKYWMSEISYGYGTDWSLTKMKTALELANNCARDINIMDPAAWVYWQAIEDLAGNMNNETNFGLIHLNFLDPEEAKIKYPKIDMAERGMEKGDYELPKHYYTMGQYSRYIRPGYSFVKTNAEEANGISRVAAVSPNGDELVFVITNNNSSVSKINLDVSAFAPNGKVAKTVETNTEKSWYESSVAVKNGKIELELDGQSVITVIVDKNDAPVITEIAGTKLSNESGKITGTFLGLNGEEVAPAEEGEASAVSYEVVIGTDKRMLAAPEEGKLTVTDGKFVIDGLDANQTYFVAVNAKTADKTLTSNVEEVRIVEAQSGLLYYVSVGNIMPKRYDGKFLPIGEYQSNLNQSFGTDLATGKEWGWSVSGGATLNNFVYSRMGREEPMAYNSDEQTGNGVTFKFKVESADTNLRAVIGLADPWGDDGRKTDILVNGITEHTDVLAGNNSVKTFTVENVQPDEDGYVTIRAEAKADKAVTVAFVLLERASSQTIVDFSLGQVDVPYGDSIIDALPNKLSVTYSDGTNAEVDFKVDAFAYEDFNAPGVANMVSCSVGDFEFKIKVLNKTEVTNYYFVDCGNTKKTDYFDGFRLANPNLLNTVNDQRSTGEGVFGYYTADDGTDKAWNPWESWDDGDGDGETIPGSQVMWTPVREGLNRAGYRFPNLPKGITYEIVLGGYCANEHGDIIADVKVKDGENEYVQVKQISCARGTSYEESFSYTKMTDGDLCVYLDNTQVANSQWNTFALPLAYILIRSGNSSSSGEAISTPTPDPAVEGVTEETTELTVSNLVVGNKLILADQNKNLIKDVKITATEMTVTGLDLHGVTTIELLQINEKNQSRPSAFVSVLNLDIVGNPDMWHVGWVALEAKFTLNSGFRKLTVSYTDSESVPHETDISKERYFVPTENGDYTFKLETAFGSLEKTVTVDRVEQIGVEIENPLSAWSVDDYTMKIGVNATQGVRKIEVIDGDSVSDVTEAKAYTFDKNKKVTVKVTSTTGSVLLYEVNVTKIDKVAPELILNVENGNNLLAVNAEAFAASGTTLYLNGVKLIKPYCVFDEEGDYTFKAVSGSGNITEKTISVKYSENLSKAQLSKQEGNRYSVIKTDKEIANISVSKGEQAIAVENGAFEFTENGRYIVNVTYADGTSECALISVNSIGNTPIPSEGKGGNTSSDYTSFAIALAVSFVAMGGLAVGGIFVARSLLKKKRSK